MVPACSSESRNLQRASDIKSTIDARRALLIVQIDPQFERHLLSGQRAAVQLIADGRNSNTAGTAMGYFADIVDRFNSSWGRDHGAGATPVQLVARAWYNPNLETRWFMIPGMIGTLTLLQTMMLTAMSVAREREQGTFDQLLVTPFRPFEIMAGKALPSMVVGTIQAGGVLLVAQLWFRIPFVGSYVDALCGIAAVFAGGRGYRIAALGRCRDHAAGHALFDAADHALLVALGTDDADQQHAAGGAIPYRHQSAELCDRYHPACIPRRGGLGSADCRSVAAWRSSPCSAWAPLPGCSGTAMQ